MAVQPEQTVVEPYEEQEPFLWDSHRYYGFISGVGAGKTAVGVMRTALNAELWNRGSMGAIVAPSTRMIKNAIFPVMKDFGLRDRWEFSGFQAEEPGFTTPDEGRIVILSADNERTVERLANLNLSFWWLDEAKETPRRAREILQERLRVGNYRNGFITTTPKGYDHNYDFFVGDPEGNDALEERGYGEATLYEGYDDRLCVAHVPSWANPHTPEDYHEEMRNLPDRLRSQQAEGQFVEVAAGVYDLEMFQFIDPEDLQDTNYQTIIAIDPAATVDAQRAESQDSDYWAVVVGQAHPRHNRLFITDVARQRGLTLQQGCEWIGQIAGTAPDAKVVAEANQSQAWLIDELKNYGVHAQGHTSTREKEARLLDLTIPIANSVIQFVDWPDVERPYGDLISEALSFPDGSHDDTVDALALCAEYAPVRMGANIMGANPWSEEGEGDEGDPRYA